MEDTRTPQKRWKDKNREKYLAQQKEYRSKPEVKERTGKWIGERVKDDPRYKADAAKKYRDRFTAIIIAAKTNKPCVDCGVLLPPQVMEFDHVRGKKLFTISHWHSYALAGTGKTKEEAVLEEIAKCDIRCPNCHDLRHFYERSGNYANNCLVIVDEVG